LASHFDKVTAEKAIVVGVGLKTDDLHEIKDSLLELEDLAVAAGAEVIGSAVQILPKFVPATLMGTGKAEEIKNQIVESGATVVVVDHPLAGSQSRNLQEMFGIRVLDRSQLILDIFAQRAQTYEGKLQVELAQLMDQLPRMVGGWLGSLSRQGGGIGTRGPGETALEVDRRRAHEKIDMIKEKLELVRKNRAQYRAGRIKQKIPSFALIGYTNAGKSTLLNRLTDAKVLVKDQVFATLDPTTRKVQLPGVQESVLTDTVGFIRKLPTHLIEAFKATLEESSDADVLLHVVDLSSEYMESQISVVEEMAKKFGWDTKPMIYVFNKVDAAPFERQMQVKNFPRVFVSGLTGQGLEKLKMLMTESVKKLSQEVELYFPMTESYMIYDLGRESKITRKEEAPNGTVCIAELTDGQMSKWGKFIVK
jgi:GTP-binding protein HflX